MQNSLFLHQRLHSLSLCYFFYSLSSTQHSLSLAFNNLKSSKISISSNLIYLLKPWLVVKAPESFFFGFFAFYFKGKEESKKRADADGSNFFWVDESLDFEKNHLTKKGYEVSDPWLSWGLCFDGSWQGIGVLLKPKLNLDLYSL